MQINRSILILIYFFLTSVSAIAQETEIPRYTPEPGQTFEFDEFQRGFPPEEVRKELDKLKAKDKSQWNEEDSLMFAINLLKIGRHLKSAVIFNKIPSPFIRDKEILKFKLMAFERTQNLGLASSLLEELSIRFPEDKVQWDVWSRMIQSRNTIKLGNKPDYKNLDFIHITNLKNLDQESLLVYLNEIDNLLHFMIHFYEEDDKILAELCYEFGVILKEKVAYTPAYIALYLARNYDRKSNKILDELKEVKAYLNKNKYKIPPFRRYFPKIKEGRFDYEFLKEKKIANKEDSILHEPPQMMVPPEKKKDLLPYNQNLLFGGVFLLMLILVLIFVRTDRKKNKKKKVKKKK